MSGYVTTDGGPKRMRLLEPQGEPDIIECDGREYVPLDGSNWARLFGTPERAADTLYEVCGHEFREWCTMGDCPMAEHDGRTAIVSCKLRDGAAAYLREEADNALHSQSD